MLKKNVQMVNLERNVRKTVPSSVHLYPILQTSTALAVQGSARRVAFEAGTGGLATTGVGVTALMTSVINTMDIAQSPVGTTTRATFVTFHMKQNKV